MTKDKNDIIDYLVGSSLQLRKRRPVTYEQIQKSYDALFFPKETGAFTQEYRYAVALFVAALHQKADIVIFYQNELNAFDKTLADKILKLAQTTLTKGPFGKYPEGPLSNENSDGLIWKPHNSEIEFLGAFLSPAFIFAHQLIFHPRDANKSDLNDLLKAGWQQKDIVTLAQLISYLAFQIRLITGLQVLNNNSQNQGEKNVG